MNTKEFNKELKDVVERNVDAYKGYEKAAEKVKNPGLANAFRNQSAQRKQFAYELASTANVYDDENKLRNIENGSFEGNLHRTWMDVKSAFSTDKDESIVEECIRGEREALDEYEELTREGYLPGELSNRITQQKETIRQCIQELEQLERQLD